MKQNEDTKLKLAFVFFELLFVVSVFPLISFNMCQPLSDDDIQECIQIANDIYYNQKDAVIYDLPENYKVKIDLTSITVEPTDERYGLVKCTVHNGEFISTYDDCMIEYLALCAFLTILSLFSIILITIVVFTIFTKISDLSSKKARKIA